MVPWWRNMTCFNRLIHHRHETWFFVDTLGFMLILDSRVIVKSTSHHLPKPKLALELESYPYTIYIYVNIYIHVNVVLNITRSETKSAVSSSSNPQLSEFRAVSFQLQSLRYIIYLFTPLRYTIYLHWSYACRKFCIYRCVFLTKALSGEKTWYHYSW